MRAIDADALLESYKESFDLLNSAYEETEDAFEKEILKAQLMSFAECGCRAKEAPTLTLDDLRPKGRWEKFEETSSGWKQHRCSVCKAEGIFGYTYTDDYDEGIDGEWEYIGQIEDGIIEHQTDFCPSCGADMRGGGEDA